jgi:hypothetical protein
MSLNYFKLHVSPLPDAPVSARWVMLVRGMPYVRPRMQLGLRSFIIRFPQHPCATFLSAFTLQFEFTERQPVADCVVQGFGRHPNRRGVGSLPDRRRHRHSRCGMFQWTQLRRGGEIGAVWGRALWLFMVFAPAWRWVECADAPMVVPYTGAVDPTPALAAKGGGIFPFRFEIFDASTGGKLLHSEEQRVVITGARFVVLIGQTRLLPADLLPQADRLWLQVSADLNENGFGGEDLIKPRVNLGPHFAKLTLDRAESLPPRPTEAVSASDIPIAEPPPSPTRSGGASQTAVQGGAGILIAGGEFVDFSEDTTRFQGPPGPPGEQGPQ